MRKLRVNNSLDCFNRLGEPFHSTNGLARINLPFPLRLAWDKDRVINSFLVHPIIHNDLASVYQDILYCYGHEDITSLRIDLWGGCYNNRLKRGAKRYVRSNVSSHSWAIAIDHDPEHNRLRWRSDKAHFARPEYQDMMDIWYRHGFYNLGIEKGYDYMHFEYALNT